ncbi:MAG: glycosyltransferase family 9 protein [Candidatus Eremiobacteraeota bacterium]|nr:glycosyltransferase family 9 protein [Candidatus Eremiobacteraeota bacterium]
MGKKILIIHLAGGLGDLLLSTALLEPLRHHFPRSSVTMMVRDELREAVEGHPALDGVIGVPGGNLKGWGNLSRRAEALRKESFDTGIVLWSRVEEAWLLFLSGIPTRVGQDSRLFYSFLYTHRVRVRSEHHDTTSHWVDIMLDYARILGCEAEAPEVAIHVDGKSEERAGAILARAGWDGSSPLIGFHVGKGLPLDEKRWPVNFFAGLADAVAGRFGGRVLLTGSGMERGLVNAVATLMKQKPLNIAGETSIKELAAVISRCQVFVCPDSAPMHLAAAMKVPTVGIFALASDFPSRWRPYGTEYEVVLPPGRRCAKKCVKEHCNDFSCYHDIPVADVLDAIERLTGKRRKFNQVP